jgi:HEPN domain-containing protein
MTDLKAGSEMSERKNIAMSEAARIGWEAGLVFKGSRDFLLAWELLNQRGHAPEVQAGQAPWPHQAAATCAGFALELALKCSLVLDGKASAKGHSYVKLFRALSRAAQESIVSVIRVDGRQATVEDLFRVLQEFEGTFEQWRYLHERLASFKPTEFHEGGIIAVIRAIHESIIRLRPDFKPWPGVIDPNA